MKVSELNTNEFNDSLRRNFVEFCKDNPNIQTTQDFQYFIDEYETTQDVENELIDTIYYNTDGVKSDMSSWVAFEDMKLFEMFCLKNK